MATKATLINSAGKKVVVESGSQDAQKYFGQGYTLMGADKKTEAPAAPAAPSVSSFTPPAGYTKVPNVAALSSYEKTVKDPNSDAIYGIAKTPTNTEEATALINSNQDEDIANKQKTDEPPIRTSVQNYNNIFSQISSSLTKDLGKKPETISMADTYAKLKADAGVSELETSLADLNKQARDLQAISAARTAAERNKPVATNVIAGRISEEEYQDNLRLREINDSIKTVTDQLTTKYSTIDSIMKYTALDYDNAVKSYDSQFSQNISVMNLVKGIADTEASDEEKKADNARSNLQIIYNSMKDNKIDPATMDEAQKANIMKLELQAGLPQGFYANVVEKNPQSEIISTTTRENGTQKYADIILRDKDGKITTKSVYLGAAVNQRSGSGGGETEAELKRKAISNMGKDLQTMVGGDGYVSPNDYKKGRQLWINAGRSSAEYDEAFKSYVNPEQYYDVGLTQ